MKNPICNNKIYIVHDVNEGVSLPVVVVVLLDRQVQDRGAWCGHRWFVVFGIVLHLFQLEAFHYLACHVICVRRLGHVHLQLRCEIKRCTNDRLSATSAITLQA